MISCQVREAARRLTCPQLATAGLDPVVFTSPCDPAGPEQNAEVSRRALQWAERRGCDLLFVEDDIDVDQERFAEALTASRRLDHVTYLYLNDFPEKMAHQYGAALKSKILEGLPIEKTLHRVRHYRALYGTQCVYIPQRHVPVLLRKLQPDYYAPHHPFDGRLFKAVSKYSIPTYIAVPHPVQHRQDRTGRTPLAQQRISRSYGLPAIGDTYTPDS
jgi:hypothetical protein